MARKRKPISREEQSRRFTEAAREAGVEPDDVTLKRVVREIAKLPPKQRKKSPAKK